MLENHHQFTQKLLVAVSRRKSPTMIAAAISMRMVDFEGVQNDLRLAEAILPEDDALATIIPFTVAGRRSPIERSGPASDIVRIVPLCR